MEEVPHLLEGYPPPAPPHSRRKEIFHPGDFADVDSRAKQAPGNLVDSFDNLLKYLLKDLTSDLAKVRSIFTWLTVQPVITGSFPKAVKPNTPQAWLKRIKFDRTLYTDLFAVMCRKAEVPCVIIEGSSKGAGYEVGQKGPLKLTNRWNAVHVQGSWRLVNVPWACITTDGLAEGDWDLVEKDGQAVREREVSNKDVQEDLDEFWFLTDPEDFNAFCHAKEPRWQLLEDPWTDDDFLNAPRYAEDLFGSDWELLGDGAGDVKADGGKCQIVFQHTPEVQRASLMYNLYFNVKLSPKPLPEELQLDRYVVEDSKVGQKKLVTRLPQDGVYRLEVAGVLDGVITALGEFRISSVNVNRPAPFPEGCTQIGYNEVAAGAGLTEPSHEDGIVQAKAGERVTFSFKRMERQTQPGEITAHLTNNERNSDDLRGCVKVASTTDDVNVTVRVPRDSKLTNNEYGVCIGLLSAASGDGDNQSGDIDYTPLVNYIITQDIQLTFPAEKQSIQRKSDLLKAIKNFDVASVYKSLEGGGVLDPVTNSKVTKFLTEVNKLKIERLGILVQAMNGSEVNKLEQALAEYEEVENQNSETILQAKAMLDLLRALKDDNDMQPLEKALRRAYDTKLKRSANIQRAEDTLVTYYDKGITDAYYKRTLEALVEAFRRVALSCVADIVRKEFMYKKAEDLRQHLEEVKKLTDKIGRLTSKELKKMAGARGKGPHPHVQSVLMATFILLGEREQELWNWETVQNLLERRGELGVARAMQTIDVDKLTDKQVSLAEGHVRSCQLDVVRAENSNTALFLQWVNSTVEEKRARDAVRHHHTQISNNR